VVIVVVVVISMHMLYLFSQVLSHVQVDGYIMNCDLTPSAKVAHRNKKDLTASRQTIALASCDGSGLVVVVDSRSREDRVVFDSDQRSPLSGAQHRLEALHVHKDVGSDILIRVVANLQHIMQTVVAVVALSADCGGMLTLGLHL
jgi:hypothetical protein